MVRATICTALAMLLLSATVAEAKSRGRRSSGGSTHYYHSSTSGGSRDRSDAQGQPTPASGPAQFQSCPPHAPCTTASGLKYVTDPTTGVSRFLPK